MHVYNSGLKGHVSNMNPCVACTSCEGKDITLECIGRDYRVRVNLAKLSSVVQTRARVTLEGALLDLLLVHFWHGQMNTLVYCVYGVITVTREYPHCSESWRFKIEIPFR